ncbi:hypothetical protein TY91_09150 [Secundilactobacillus collinoides]|uniref:Uncharacterized protein n=1 Tax=Secundilactobacillus collinoides TaxID=33960 RepID=A0A166GQW0_SECCO|nr:hypothetical protein TY91_09150 [Secundilactobacillus collinoides]
MCQKQTVTVMLAIVFPQIVRWVAARSLSKEKAAWMSTREMACNSDQIMAHNRIPHCTLMVKIVKIDSNHLLP